MMTTDMMSEGNRKFQEFIQTFKQFQEIARQEVHIKDNLRKELDFIKTKNRSQVWNSLEQIERLEETNEELKQTIVVLSEELNKLAECLSKQRIPDPNQTIVSDNPLLNQLRQQIIANKTEYEDIIKELETFYENKFNRIYDYHQKIVKRLEYKINEIRNSCEEEVTNRLNETHRKRDKAYEELNRKYHNLKIVFDTQMSKNWKNNPMETTFDMNFKSPNNSYVKRQ